MERFGLFTIIVLGEVVFGVVDGLSAHDRDREDEHECQYRRQLAALAAPERVAPSTGSAGWLLLAAASVFVPHFVSHPFCPPCGERHSRRSPP